MSRSQTPKSSPFSGNDLKRDVPFAHWKYEVETLSMVYTESAIKEAITKSLRGSVAEALRSLGPLASAADILISMKGKYGVAAFYNSLMRDFLLLSRKKMRKFPSLLPRQKSSCLLSNRGSPQRFVGNVKSNALRDRLFFGLKKEIRHSISFKYNDTKISYSELLRFARETEVEDGGAGSGSKGKLIQGPRLRLPQL